MNREAFLDYLRGRIAGDRDALRQMENGELKTSTNGNDDTDRSIKALRRDIPTMEALRDWILNQ